METSDFRGGDGTRIGVGWPRDGGEKEKERERGIERRKRGGGPPLSSDYEGATRWAAREWGDEIRFALAAISRQAARSK